MKTKLQKGFTLAELICAIAATLIVILAGGAVLATSHISWNRSWKKVNLQRDASYAMLIISRHIKAGTSAVPEDDGKAIKIYKDANWIRISLDQGSNDLKCESGGKTADTIIRGNVEDLKFDVDNNKVTISLILKEDDLVTHFVSDATVRNYGE